MKKYNLVFAALLTTLQLHGSMVPKADALNKLEQTLLPLDPGGKWPFFNGVIAITHGTYNPEMAKKSASFQEVLERLAKTVANAESFDAEYLDRITSNLVGLVRISNALLPALKSNAPEKEALQEQQTHFKTALLQDLPR